MSPREQLSRKEINVATMVWEGKTNPEIAACLGSSEQVIKNQLRGVFDKLGVWSRLALISQQKNKKAVVSWHNSYSE